MIQPTEKQLNTIKKIAIGITMDIDRVCRSLGINYSIMYGSLIGAARHKGFIPWDDDIDIVMLREDYERFLKQAPALMNDAYYIVNYEKSSAFGESFCKVMAKNTILEEVFTSKCDAEKGVFVDIFPLDDIPDNGMKVQIHMLINWFTRKMILLNRGYFFGKKGIMAVLYGCLKIISKTVPSDVWVKAHKKNALRFARNKSEYVANLCGSYGYRKETFRKEWFNDLVELEFEKNKLYAPAEYDLILSNIYGNYMKLPPVEQRVNRHSIFSLDLGGYEEL